MASGDACQSKKAALDLKVNAKRKNDKKKQLKRL